MVTCAHPAMLIKLTYVIRLLSFLHTADLYIDMKSLCIHCSVKWIHVYVKEASAEWGKKHRVPVQVENPVDWG